MIDIGDAILFFKGDSTGMDKAMASVEGNVKGSMEASIAGAQKAGLAMTAFGAATTGALGVAVAKATDFQSTMAEVNTLGVEDLGALSDAVKDVSVAYGLDLTDAAKATYQAISAGASEAEVPKLLENAAIAAKAGMTDLTTAIELGTSVTNAYGGSLSDVNDIYDQAFISVKNGVTTFEELSSSVGKISPLFNAAGLSSQEMFASITALTKAGINTAESVTGVKAAITGIIKPTTEASEIADLLGFDFSATGLKAKGLKGFLDELGTAIRDRGPELAEQQKQLGLTIEQFGGTSEELKVLKRQYENLEDVSEDQLTMMAAMFGSVEGLNAVLALTGSSAEAFGATLEEMNTTTGATNAAFEKFKEASPQFAFDQLKATLAALTVEVGEALLPILLDLTRAVVPVIKSTLEWMQAHEGLTKTIVVLVGSLGVLATAFGPILVMLPGVVSMFGLLGGGAGVTAGGGLIALVGTGITALLPILAALGVAFVVLLPLISAVVKSHRDLAEAQEQERLSKERLIAEEQKYEAQLKAKGIALTEAEQLEVGSNERIVAANKQMLIHRDALLRGELENYAKRKLTQEEFYSASLLVLNEFINEKQAVALILDGISVDEAKSLARAGKAETEAALEKIGALGLVVEARADAADEEEKINEKVNEGQQRLRQFTHKNLSEIAFITKRETAIANDAMMGLSPTVRNSPSVLDMVAAGFNELISFMEAAQNRILSIAQIIGDAFAGIQYALDWLFGGGGGGGGMPPVQSRASGGPIKAGQPYIINDPGPELIVPNVDSMVFSAPETRNMLSGIGGLGGGVNVTGNTFVIREEADIDKVSRQLFQLIRAEGRA